MDCETGQRQRRTTYPKDQDRDPGLDERHCDTGDRVGLVKERALVKRRREQREKSPGKDAQTNHAEGRCTSEREIPSRTPQTRRRNSETSNQDQDRGSVYPVEGNTVDFSGGSVVDNEADQQGTKRATASAPRGGR